MGSRAGLALIPLYLRSGFASTSVGLRKLSVPRSSAECPELRAYAQAMQQLLPLQLGHQELVQQQLQQQLLEVTCLDACATGGISLTCLDASISI